MINFNSSQKLY